MEIKELINMNENRGNSQYPHINQIVHMKLCTVLLRMKGN